MAPNLYQQDLLRLAAETRNAARLDNPDGSARVDNPLCGDRITMDVKLRDGEIEQVGYQVKACLLCQASAAVIGARSAGLSIDDALRAAGQTRGLLEGDVDESSLTWPDLKAFLPVREVKSRHICVTLPLQALEQALQEAQNASHE